MEIHQALHGYDQGHNRLGCSIGLSPFDDDSMKMLSDWSEFSDGNDNSYITAYPLRDSNYYVVAKTWYAKEMDRPGCVWTHSLLIDIESISEDFDFRDLDFLFQKPQEGEYSKYNEPIEYNSHQQSSPVFPNNILIWLYTNLIGECKQSLYKVEQSSSYYQSLCLLLLQYIPLGMLNKVSLCSGTAVARHFRDGLNNIQFATSTGDSLPKIVEQKQDVISSVCAGIASICRSMQIEMLDTDRAMRIFSSDIGNDTMKLCAFGVLMHVLDEKLANNESQFDFVDIVSVLASSFPNKNEGILLKNTFCQQRVSSLFAVESVVLSALVDKVGDEVFDYDMLNYDQRVSDLYINDKIGLFEYLKLLGCSESPNTKAIFQLRQWANRLNASDFAQLLNFDWTAFRSLVQVNNNILRYGFWVHLPEQQFLPLYDEFRKNPLSEFDSWELLFSRVLYNNYTIDDRIFSFFVHNVKTLVSYVMDYLDTALEYKIEPLVLDYCRSNTMLVLDWLSKRTRYGRFTQRFILESVKPDDLRIKDTPISCWESLYNRNTDESIYYYSYIFKLGYNWKDAFGLKCIKKGFYPLHTALSKSSLPDDLWGQIEPYTASLFFLQEWDRCKKLRKGVARYLKNSGYQRSVLMDFTPESEINNQMMKFWDE